MATSKQQPYGITLPIQHGAGGYFNQSYTVLDQIRSNLINLLQTKKGERRMNPTFGSDLYKILFEFNVDELEPIINSTIRDDIQTWLPYLTVQNVVIDTRNEYRDIYTIQIKITFTVNGIGITEAQTVNFTVDKPII